MNEHKNVHSMFTIKHRQIIDYCNKFRLLTFCTMFITITVLINFFITVTTVGNPDNPDTLIR